MKQGNQTLNITSKAQFEGSQYLQPVLEDDALLYNLDDLDAATELDPIGKGQGQTVQPEVTTQVTRVIELEKELRLLQKQLADHQSAVNDFLEEKWNANDNTDNTDASNVQPSLSILNNTKSMAHTMEDDSDYFASYSYNGKSFPSKTSNS